MRYLVPRLAAVAVVLAAAPALAESGTTRIETRPFYGAVITLEEGVRVFRPLPPTRNMVINPGGTTPLNLWLSDVRVEEHRTSTSYNYIEDSRRGVVGNVGGVFGGVDGFRGRGHHGFRGRPAGAIFGSSGSGKVGGPR